MDSLSFRRGGGCLRLFSGFGLFGAVCYGHEGQLCRREILPPYSTMIEKNLALSCVIAALLLVGLNACADTRWPSSLTGEPPPEVTQAPRVVARPAASQAQDFPNLAIVPAKPSDYTPAAERQQRINELKQARQDAEAVRQRLGTAP